MPKSNALDNADTQIGIAEAALLKAANALNRHGGRDYMVSALRAIRTHLKAMEPVEKDIDP